jgi:hypothetical protein
MERRGDEGGTFDVQGREERIRVRRVGVDVVKV